MGIKISWSSEIPKFIRNFRDGMITLFSGLIPFQEVIADWLKTSTETFTTICGIGILATGVFAKMFGVSDTAVTVDKTADNKD
jgi:hypothetical protein